MSFILKTDKIWLISVFGALSHVIGQLIAAYLLINLKQILYFAPILMLSAIITGIFTGVTSQLIYKRMKNIKLK